MQNSLYELLDIAEEMTSELEHKFLDMCNLKNEGDDFFKIEEKPLKKDKYGVKTMRNETHLTQKKAEKEQRKKKGLENK